MTQGAQYNRHRVLLTLGIIWLAGALCDRIWFAFDRDVPAWDQADYLTGTLNYWQALQNPQWLSGEWWTSFWQITPKVPPLTYIIGAIVQNLFGRGPDQATLVNLLFSAILIISVYGLGEKLFNPRVGLWAALLCQLLPALYRYRLDFLLDYPLTAVVTFSFYCLTVWRFVGTTETQRTQRGKEEEVIPNRKSKIENRKSAQWLWAAAFGFSLGLALLVKQTALLFLFIPILWVLAGAIRRRAWGRLTQLVGALLISVLVFGPWCRTNWLLILTSGKRATVDSAIAEGDPALNTIDAWIYYWKILPYLVSWPLLLVPIVGILLYGLKRFIQQKNTAGKAHQQQLTPHASAIKWLAVFLVGAYLLCSLNINKDARYVLPLLPVLSLFLAYGLTLWTGRWTKQIRWGTVSLAILLMLLNLWPVGGGIVTQILSPRVQHYAYLGDKFPHQQVISEIIKTEPYLVSTLGVLPSTPEINQHNLNYYGALANFQVYGRQVGTRQKFVPQDARSLSWFLTKTGDQGSVPTEAQSAIVQLVEQGSDFQLQKTWNLPDQSTLKLYHRRQPSITVQPLSKAEKQGNTQKIRLNRVTVPTRSPSGVAVPVTYEWSGPWEQLQSGLVLLTWKAIPTPATNRSRDNLTSPPTPLLQGEGSPTPPFPTREGGQGGLGLSRFRLVAAKSPNIQSRWLHDHGIGMGSLYLDTQNKKDSVGEFRVIEKTAMLPPAKIPAGTYTLEATYLNRQTGQSYPISVPPVTLNIDPTATATPAPELDLITQMRTLAAYLPKGPKALEPVFDQTGRINQYDPIQDYLKQASQALKYRLQQEPKNLEWAYALAFTKVQQQQATEAIAALTKVTQLDSQNPYAYGYLAFVNLYDWRPKAAQAALKPGLALNPNLPELQALDGVAALMQGNLVKAWHRIQQFTSQKA